MTAEQRELFAALCEEENAAPSTRGSGIGTYGEKRLHRILKRFACDDADAWEIPVGGYVADVRTEEDLVEIQTGSFRPLTAKLTYYLTQTDYRVTVICPILSQMRILRMDRETGEILRDRRSPKKGTPMDALVQLYWLRELFPSERFTVRVLLIRAEEHRYSERMRYRKAGAYDAELFPLELLDEVFFHSIEDLTPYLPPEEVFTAAEYGKVFGLKPRPANAVLQLLCAVGLLERKAEGRKYLYRRTEKKEA